MSERSLTAMLMLARRWVCLAICCSVGLASTMWCWCSVVWVRAREQWELPRARLSYHDATIAPNKYATRSTLFVVVYLLALFALCC